MKRCFHGLYCSSDDNFNGTMNNSNNNSFKFTMYHRCGGVPSMRMLPWWQASYQKGAVCTDLTVTVDAVLTHLHEVLCAPTLPLP